METQIDGRVEVVIVFTTYMDVINLRTTHLPFSFPSSHMHVAGLRHVFGGFCGFGHKHSLQLEIDEILTC